MKIRALLDCFHDGDLSERYAKENFKMSFLIRFLTFVMPEILTCFTLIIHAKIQGLSEKFFYDIRVFIFIVTTISAEAMIFMVLAHSLKSENPGETLFTFKNMFLLITEVVLIFFTSNGFQSLTEDITARDEERQPAVVMLTIFTYFACNLATSVVSKAFYRRNIQSTSDLGSENGIKHREICNPNKEN